MPTSVPGATPGVLGQVALAAAVYWPKPHAWNHDRFSVRSLPTLRIRNRTGPAGTDSLGYAVPLTTGVSMKASGTRDAVLPAPIFGPPAAFRVGAGSRTLGKPGHIQVG